ncbi:beta-hydroxyacyl-ACP dehydratase [Paenibacillus thiaminolyticus]|uniref:3-hydroxyacyl-ACP dehydratase FabZ family protein n=1 Tax=Paenibacillus thiaminolyticus TaxID=49283 RepID=UPI001164B8ED|nr:3-hydroxyacyl-ACP dehydratase FabZ family protein [Paenibacillus thiaminolyticus]NGP58913.1 beta-hydroxyacyl-ACP dehydratase [Paenibacillus thiaminolyticus]
MTDNHNTITDRLPHRYPFLMVDRITGIQAGQWAKGTKKVTGTEWYFAGKAAEQTMPHTIIVEALAQLGALAAMGQGGRLGFLSSIKGAEFCGHASPGDCLDLEYKLIKARRGFVVGSGKATVEGKVIVSVDEIMVYVESDTKESLL